MTKLKTIEKTFQVTDEGGETILKFKKRLLPWWLVLLLLPLVLLIQIPKDIVFKVAWDYDNNPCINKEVQFSYLKKDLFSFEEGEFFTTSMLSSTPSSDTTDEDGRVKFTTEYSLYHLLLKSFTIDDTAFVSVLENNCSQGDSIYQYFDLSSKENTLYVSLKKTSFPIYAFDMEDNQPLPNVLITLRDSVGRIVDSARSNPSGKVLFKSIPVCSNVNVVGSLYGWGNDTISTDVQDIVNRDSILFMPQVKNIVKFYVNSLYSRKPVAGAHGQMFVKLNKNEQFGGDAISNLNGIAKGVASFDKTHILKEIAIKVNYEGQLHQYHDTSSLDYMDWERVDRWNSKSVKEQTLSLRPKFFDLDIVLVVDETGSMSSVIEEVKNKSNEIYADLKNQMNHCDKYARSISVKVIHFANDCSNNEKNINESRFFSIPHEVKEYEEAVKVIYADGQAESSYESLGLAFTSKFRNTGVLNRKIILLITDDKPLGLGDNCYSFSAARIPGSVLDLKKMWYKIKDNSTLMMIAPKMQEWEDIDAWENSYLIPTTKVDSDDYIKALKAIANAI